jgi:lysyl-tRNA synthetase class 1
MRWVALGVDYEMYGKDLTDSGVQSGKIAQVLGGRKPEGLIYEMFLDEKGEKISKSKGNGLSLEEWLTYGSEESLAFYAYREPKSAKQLHIGVIPRAVDEYEQFRGNYASQPLDKQLGNPVHHIHAARGEAVPTQALPVSYGLLLNLVGVMGAEATAEQRVGLSLQLCRGGVRGKLSAARRAGGECARVQPRFHRPDVEAPQARGE